MPGKNKKTGEITYYLQMLGAAIVHPDFKEVISLCPEMIIKQDGTTKNDKELLRQLEDNAADFLFYLTTPY